jgi:hypothetical protein
VNPETPRPTHEATAKNPKPAQRSKVSPALKMPKNPPRHAKKEFAGKFDKKGKKTAK